MSVTDVWTRWRSGRVAEKIIDVRGFFSDSLTRSSFGHSSISRSAIALPVTDHDPRPLRYQFDAGYDGRCKWTYLEQSPEVWRVCLQR